MVTIPPKKVVNADTGDADHVGGNDWDDFVDYVHLLSGYSSVVFKISSTYYAVKFNGSLISSGAVPETVIQAALNLGGDIYIADNRENGANFGVD
jgi:hypothetical protein